MVLNENWRTRVSSQDAYHPLTFPCPARAFHRGVEGRNRHYQRGNRSNKPGNRRNTQRALLALLLAVPKLYVSWLKMGTRSKAEILRSRLRERVVRKKNEAREEHVVDTKKKIVEFQVLTAQAQSLTADIDKVSAKILLDQDEDEDAKLLALKKLREQRVSLEKHIGGWKESMGVLEDHLRLLNESLKG